MHRSGTSLVSRCLAQLGVYMGADLSPNAESLLFQNLNREILSSNDTDWDDLENLSNKCMTPEFQKSGVGLASDRLFRENRLNDFFPEQHWILKALGRKCKFWGWKDPRNTWTLPIYLELFSRVKVIHVFRNGIDCAISLNRRECDPQNSVSTKCQSFSFCFNLWEIYLRRCLDLCAKIDNNYCLQISYENLLEKPESEINKLVEFLRIRPASDKINITTKSINPKRLNNQKYREIYKGEIAELPESELMGKFNYQ